MLFTPLGLSNTVNNPNLTHLSHFINFSSLKRKIWLALLLCSTVDNGTHAILRSFVVIEKFLKFSYHYFSQGTVIIPIRW